MGKKISFIIPSYNCADTLEATVQSIRSVEEHNISIEIVLIDDGSTDGTGELCNRLGDIVIHKKNEGVSTARNIGIGRATGDYIVFVDSDDTIDAENFASVFRELQNHEQCDCAVYGIWFDYYKGMKCYRSDEILPEQNGVLGRDECYRCIDSIFEANVLSPIWNKIMRREFLAEKMLLLKEDMYLLEDLEFSLRLLQVSDYWYFSNIPVYHYRQEEKPIKSVGRLERTENLSTLVETIRAQMTRIEESEPDQCRRILLSIFHSLASQKIAGADYQTIKKVCCDYARWIDASGYRVDIENNEKALMIYNQKAAQLLKRRIISNCRHQLAVRIKSTIGDFRKWNLHRGK